MNSLDLAGLGGEPERLRRDTEEACCLVQVKPWFVPVRRMPEDRDLVI